MAGAQQLAIESLQSTHQAELLDQIEKLHSQGISHYVSLPQLIVCGDQSAGKSSVLEAISQVEFPTNDGLCTRFVTEVTLRRSRMTSASVKILPAHLFVNEERRAKLKDFEKTEVELKEVPGLIASAKEAMGLLGDSTFSQDILQLEISGPDMPHLTLVDMPGLIHTPNKSQTSKDVVFVKSLVERYMKEPRSIILAVVSAKNDHANQIVLQMAQSFDPDGLRTMGIVTKPDSLQSGSPSEASFFSLVNNHEIPFRLGWHVLRNADYSDKRNDNYHRDEAERAFFEDKPPWNTLPRSMVGIETLRTRLSKILFDHISSELPSLVSDIKSEMESCRETLKKLGTARNSSKDKQRYLLTFAERFQSLVRAGLCGQYNDPWFRPAFKRPNRRLRAVVRRLSQEFATTMEEEGHSRKISNGTSQFPATPPRVSRPHVLREIQVLLQESKGLELPGTFNPLLVFDLFVQHAEPWEWIAKKHVEDSWNAVKAYLEELVDYLVEPSVRDPVLCEILHPAMDTRLQKLKDKVDELLTPYARGPPATLNSSFVLRMQHLRKKRSEETEKNDSVEKDMDLYACSELLDCMLAYYGIARDVFVDNVEALAVENCLVQSLDEIISARTIVNMDEEELNKFGAESEESQQERRRAEEKIEILKRGLDICNRHAWRAMPARLGTNPAGTRLRFPFA